MSVLSERESALAAILAAQFPGHAIRPDAGDLAGIVRTGTIAGPTLIVRLLEWSADRGSLVWSIVAIEDDRRGAETRRVGLPGEASTGMFATIAQLRDTLGSDSGFRALGGKFVKLDAPLLAWEERIESTVSFMTADPIPAMFVTELIDEGAISSSIDAGDTLIDELAELPTGARILVCNEDGSNPTDLGETIESEPGVFTLVVPSPRAIPAGSRLLHAITTTRLPLGTHIEEREDFGKWRGTSTRLDGRFSAGRTGPRVRTLEFEFAAPTPEQRIELEGFLALAESVVQPLYLPGDGTAHALALLESRRTISPAVGTPIRLTASAIQIEHILAFVEAL